MIEFTVWGLPIPQGSMKTFHPMDSNGKLLMRGRQPVCNVVADNAGLKKWRKAVNAAGIEAWPYDEPTNEPLMIHVDFYRVAPQNRKGDRWDDTGHDGDKLMRGIFDALTETKKNRGITTNDSRFVDQRGVKLFCDQVGEERAVIKIESLNRTLIGQETRLL